MVHLYQNRSKKSSDENLLFIFTLENMINTVNTESKTPFYSVIRRTPAERYEQLGEHG